MELILFVITVALGSEIDNTKQELATTQEALVMVNDEMQMMRAGFLQYTEDTDAWLNALQDEVNMLTPTQ